jgi:hypothetical protein
MSMLRRLRGVLGTALTWGAAFALVGAAGSTLVAAVSIAVLPTGLVAAAAWSLAAGLAAVPVVGGALGRATAVAMLRAARRDLDATRPVAGAARRASALGTTPRACATGENDERIEWPPLGA